MIKRSYENTMDGLPLWGAWGCHPPRERTFAFIASGGPTGHEWLKR